MNPLDVLLIGLMLLFILFGKYDGLYTQFSRLLSILISIYLSTIMISTLMPFFIPYIGVSKYTRFMTFYLSLSIFYLAIRFIINMILYKYEPSQKNIKIQSVFGLIIGGLNGFLILSIIVSILNLGISEQVLSQLKNSTVFSYLNNFTILINVK